MKHLLLTIVLCLLPGTAFAQYGLSVVEVEVEEKTGFNLGTACLIDNDLVVTCWHAVDGENWSVNFGKQKFSGTILAASEKDEIAIVRLDRPVRGVSPLTIAVASKGQQVYVGGYAGSFDSWKLQKGEIKARGLSRYGGYTTSVSGVAPTHGNSGGPVLDTHGNLVGIVWALAGDADDDGNLVAGTEHALITEFIGILNEALPGHANWSAYANVDPYEQPKRELQWRIRELQLQLYISGNDLPVPARLENWIK